MKGLRKVLTPFAPDQSGAVGVLYEFGALIVIIDAGGCTGNICGFDEPRWQISSSAVFSAGLRDMDAILGRDELLVKKIAKAHEAIDVKFTALVGTPVPAVIATDYDALSYMIENKTGKPVVAIRTDGMHLYDKGASDAYVKLIEAFANEKKAVDKKAVGIFGALPLDMGGNDREKIKSYYLDQGYTTVRMYGTGAGLEDIENVSANALNVAVSSCGIDAVTRLNELFGTHFEITDPSKYGLTFASGRTLVVHDEVCGKTIKERSEGDVTVATFFTTHNDDIQLTEEDEFTELVMNGNWDNLVCDASLLPLIPEYKGNFISLPHFAVSSTGDES